MKSSIAIATLIALAGSPALAQNDRSNPDIGFYIGGGLGQSMLDYATLDTLEERGAAIDDRDIAYKVYSGYHFTPYFAVEASFVDFGEFSADHADGDLELGIDGFGAALLGKLPIDRVSLYAKLGMIAWEASLDHNQPDRRGSMSAKSYAESGTSPFYGAGVEYAADSLLLRGEYERYDIGNSDEDLTTDLVSASIGYRF